MILRIARWIFFHAMLNTLSNSFALTFKWQSEGTFFFAALSQVCVSTSFFGKPRRITKLTLKWMESSSGGRTSSVYFVRTNCVEKCHTDPVSVFIEIFFSISFSLPKKIKLTMFPWSVFYKFIFSTEQKASIHAKSVSTSTHRSNKISTLWPLLTDLLRNKIEWKLYTCEEA